MVTYKKYLLFAGERYYPLGGANDFVGYFKTIEVAETFALTLHNKSYLLNDYEHMIDWYHIVDSTDFNIVLSAYGHHGRFTYA